VEVVSDVTIRIVSSILPLQVLGHICVLFAVYARIEAMHSQMFESD